MAKKEKTYFRNCPQCDKQVGHLSIKSRSLCEGRPCRSCDTSKKEKKFVRQCPTCDKQLRHVSAVNRDYAEANGSVCRSCHNTRTKTGVKRKPFTAKTKARLSAAQRVTLQKKRDANTEMYGEKAYFVSGTGDLKIWANAVKERDNYTCLRCDTVGSGYHINAHHVLPKEYFGDQAYDIDNGVTLCVTCHKKMHGFLDKLTLSGVKLNAEGFQTHTSRFINGNKATNVPTEYKPVFSPSVTIVKE